MTDLPSWIVRPPAGADEAPDHRPTIGIGSRLAEIRMERGLSVQRLAAMAGLERSTIGAIEREVIVPSADHLERLSAALGALLRDASSPGGALR